MPPIKVKDIISYTSQDPKHRVRDLIDGRGPWLKLKSDKSSVQIADLQLEKATTIPYIDIGNAGSVMISVEVGRSAWPSDRPFEALISPLTFMTREEVISGRNKNSVHMFKPEDMNELTRKEEWDRVRVQCSQPYPTPAQFGLSMLKMYSGSPMSPKSGLTSNLILEETASKKDLLLSRLHLSSPEDKSKLLDKIKQIERSQFPSRKVESPGSQQRNTPLSRGGQLLMNASKVTSHQESLAKKCDLEQESLRFLLSLNLTVYEIDHIAIKDIRLKFEKNRQKPLTFPEIKIFKDIAIDFAKRRLNNLENQTTAAHLATRGVKTSEISSKVLQQKRKLEHSNKESQINEESHNGYSSHLKSDLAKQENRSLKTTDDKIQSKLIISPSSNKGQDSDEEESPCKSKYIKNSTTPNKKRDDMTPARNALTLLNADITSSQTKTNKTRNSRKTSTNQHKQQSLMGKWISPTNKTKSKENDYQYSDSDSDNVQYVREHSPLPSTSRDRTPPRMSAFSYSLKSPSSVSSNHVRSTPYSKYDTMGRGERDSSSPSHQKQRLVDCPMCFKLYPAKDIEAHAASCRTHTVSDSDSDDDNSLFRTREQSNTSELTATCPVCGMSVAPERLESHATQCASTMFD